MAEKEQKTESANVGEKSQKEVKPEAHVSKYKTKVVKELVKLMREYPIVGAIDMENMPAASLQKMRAQLREKVVMRMAKRRIMKYVFDEVKAEKKGIEKLIPHLKGMPALLFTKENPFLLFNTIKKNKTPAAAKAGQIAPKDIVVKAGPTSFVPGPVIGELGAVGIKTEVKEGKIHIKEDAVVVKEGEEVNLAAAGLLQRLGIEPMEIGLDIAAVYEEGVIYDKKVLDIDEEAFLQSLSDAGRWAFNLAVEVGHYTKETVNMLVPKAFREAKAVALEGEVMNDVTKEEILAKAESQANALKTEAKIEVGPQKEAKAEAPKEEAKPEAPKEEKKKEPKVEEKPEEKAPEPEPKPAEEAPKEEPKPEAPVEQPKEEPKVEEKAVEEKKETPVVEKKETPVVEKKEEVPAEIPKEEVKEEPKPEPEAPKEEPKVEEAPKPEEKKEPKVGESQQSSSEARAKVEREEKEVKEELKEIKEEIKEEKKDPDVKEVEKIKEKVEEVEEKLDEVEKEKKELPPTERIIIPKKEEPKPQERQIDPEKKKAAEEGEKLFEQLKKEGTLRNVKEEVKKPREPMSPQDIIAEAHKKMDKNEVPSAHDLLKKKLQKK